MLLRDAAGATLGTSRLRLGHDLHCNADSLYLSGTISMPGGVVSFVPCVGWYRHCSLYPASILTSP